MSKFVVTGASGYIGRFVAQWLADAGHDVIALVRNAESVVFAPNVDILEGDIWLHSDAVLERIARDSIIVHLAWQDGFVHTSNRHMAQLSQHFIFVEKLISFGASKIVGLGTMHELGPVSGLVSENVVPQPQNQYGIAKNALRGSLEELSSRRDVEFLWLRCFYILGDDVNNHSVFTKMLELDRAGTASMALTQGTAKFDFIDVHDLATLIGRTAAKEGLNGILNLGSGHVMSLRARIEQFATDNGLALDLQFGAFPERAGINDGCWPDVTRLTESLA